MKNDSEQLHGKGHEESFQKGYDEGYKKGYKEGYGRSHKEGETDAFYEKRYYSNPNR